MTDQTLLLDDYNGIAKRLPHPKDALRFWGVNKLSANKINRGEDSK